MHYGWCYWFVLCMVAYAGTVGAIKFPGLYFYTHACNNHYHLPFGWHTCRYHSGIAGCQDGPGGGDKK